jgi:hypothetical protein
MWFGQRELSSLLYRAWILGWGVFSDDLIPNTGYGFRGLAEAIAWHRFAHSRSVGCYYSILFL